MRVYAFIIVCVLLLCTACSQSQSTPISAPQPAPSIPAPTSTQPGSARAAPAQSTATAAPAALLPLTATAAPRPATTAPTRSGADPAPSACGIAVITGDISALALRAEPDRQSQALAEVLHGQQVTQLCDPRVTADERIWQRVSSGAVTGWMSINYLQTIDPDWVVAATLAVGDGPDEVGIHHRPGGAMVGPQALSVGQDGTIYLLDSDHTRVLAISDGQTRAITVSSTLYLEDILATAEGLFILDSRSIMQLGYDGGLINTFPLPSGLDSYKVYRLWQRSDGMVMVWASNYHEFELAHLPATVDLAALPADSPSGIAAPNGQRVRVAGAVEGELTIWTGGSANVVPIGGTGIHLLGFAADSTSYFWLESLVPDGGGTGWRVDLSVVRYAADGTLLATTLGPPLESDTVPKRPLDLASDNSLYMLASERDQITIYRHAP